MLTHQDKHARGDTISEVHLQTTHKRSTIVVEGYACNKEEASSFSELHAAGCPAPPNL